MNFNEYPLKVELSDGLHVYERKTGKSSHMLVERLISEFLIKEGYLNIAIENLVKYPKKLLDIDENIISDDDEEKNSPPCTVEIDNNKQVAPLKEISSKQTEIQEGDTQKEFFETKYVDKNNFKVLKVSKNSSKLIYGKLSFGQHPSQMIEGLINGLSKLPLLEMESISKERLESTYPISKGNYPKILRKIVDGSPEDIENIIVNSFVSFKKKSKYDGYDLRLVSTYAGYFSKEEMNEFKKYLPKLDISAMYELRDLIKNTSSKKKEVVMEFIEGYGKS